MAEYAEKAGSRGIKVIIAAAGGAAHLPGMVAAFAPTIPVIGLPIKPSIGDGTDSLTSMTNMPNGVPVLTIGVDKVLSHPSFPSPIHAFCDVHKSLFAAFRIKLGSPLPLEIVMLTKFSNLGT